MKRNIMALCILLLSFELFADNLEDVVLRNPLFSAIFHGNISEVKRQINNGQNINGIISGTFGANGMYFEFDVTPLLYAVILNKNEIAIYLISQGADINYKTFMVDYSSGNQNYSSVLFSIGSNLANKYNNDMASSQNFANYFFTLNPKIESNDIMPFANAGITRFVMEIWNRLDNAQRPSAVLFIVSGAIFGAWQGGGSFSQSHEYLVSFALNQEQYFNNDIINGLGLCVGYIGNLLPQNDSTNRVNKQILEKIRNYAIKK
jgi:hypothetical protein